MIKLDQLDLEEKLDFQVQNILDLVEIQQYRI